MLLSTAPEFPATVFKLENGLTLIHQEVPATPVAVADVWVKAGAILEPQEWSGMAHFLEHMIFKGTEKLPPGAFDQAIENRGGVSNAATSHDYAHYFITTSSDSLEETLPHLADLVLRATIPDEEFDRERDVVLEEIRQSLDDPDWLGFQALLENVYQCHPYGRPILGTEEQLMSFSPQDMRTFHRSYYQPENITVVVVGAVSQERALKLVNQAFQGFSPREKCLTAQAEAEPPMISVRRQELYLPRLEQARLMMAWLGPGIESLGSQEAALPPFLLEKVSDPGKNGHHAANGQGCRGEGCQLDPLHSAYGLDLISVLLASGRSSRLVQELREERGLVQGISSNFSLQRDSSLFTITAWLDPENVDRVEALICDRVSQLQTQPISDAELNRCKRYLCNDFAFSTETPSQLAGLYGYYSTIAQAEVAVTYPKRIRTYQAEELQHLASQYLSPYRYAATILRPLED